MPKFFYIKIKWRMPKLFIDEDKKGVRRNKEFLISDIRNNDLFKNSKLIFQGVIPRKKKSALTYEIRCFNFLTVVVSKKSCEIQDF